MRKKRKLGYINKGGSYTWQRGTVKMEKIDPLAANVKDAGIIIRAVRHEGKDI